MHLRLIKRLRMHGKVRPQWHALLITADAVNDMLCPQTLTTLRGAHRAVDVEWNDGEEFAVRPSGSATAGGKIPVSEVCRECWGALMKAWTAVEG